MKVDISAINKGFEKCTGDIRTFATVMISNTQNFSGNILEENGKNGKIKEHLLGHFSTWIIILI